MTDRMQRKASTSMEFFAGYSRVIMIVLITLAVLTHFGVFTSGYLVLESCTAFEGMGCMDVSVSSTEIHLRLANGIGHDLTINNITAAECQNPANGTLKNGEEKTFIITGCSLVSGEKYRDEFRVTYTGGYSTIPHTKHGQISKKVK